MSFELYTKQYFGSLEGLLFLRPVLYVLSVDVPSYDSVATEPFCILDI